MNLVTGLASSLQGKYLPDCRKTLAAVQDKFCAERCKKSLETITFQNKVALRRSLKNEDGPLGDCVNTSIDFKDLQTDYSGPRLPENKKIDDQFIQDLRNFYSFGGILPPQVLYRVLQQTEQCLRSTPTSLVEVDLDEDTSLHVCGDIHGQFKDLLNIFFLKGEPGKESSYLFNGDIVDRGPASIPCIVLIFALKCLYPYKIFINRGNHEATGMNLKDGFYAEVMEAYNDTFLFTYLQEIFSWLPSSTLVKKKILIVHGGLSSVKDFNLDDIRKLPIGRSIQPEDNDILCDILWSDPMVIGKGLEENRRGGGTMFGSDVTAKFLNRNNLQCLIRSHTEILEGCICIHAGCYTVFSAPNKSKNVLGGVLTLHPTESDQLRLEGFVFQQTN